MLSSINNLKLALKEFLKEEDIITTVAAISPYLLEKRGNFNSSTSVVVTPNTTEEVSKILQCCNNLKIEVVPLGGNTGLVGGGVANNNQIILSLKKLNKIHELDIINQTITLEAGVSLLTAIEFCKKHNLLFPLDLPSRKDALIGGNLSTNAGGLTTIKYGQAKSFTLGLEVVLANGHIISDLNKLTKRNIGPDYKNLFIGSEGILGVITAATFKLQPMPKQSIHILLSTNSIDYSIKAFLNFRETFAWQISAFEIMSNIAINISLEEYPSNFFPLNKSASWYVLTTIDFYNNSKNNLQEIQDFLTKLQNSKQIDEFYIAENTKELWAFRDIMSKAQSKRGASIKHDIAIPLSKTEEFVTKAINKVKELTPVAIPVIFGHMGDQSLHFNFSANTKALDDNKMLLALKPKINKIVTSLALEHQGNFSAEHGVGLLHQESLQKYYFNNQYYMIKLLKKSLDPNNILNPNKVVLKN